MTSLSMTGVATGTVAWTYDTRFRANREEVNGAHAVDVSFDDDSLPTDIVDLALKREATTGRVSEAILAYHVTTSFAYTPYGEVASAVTKADETGVLDLAFTYDVLGRIVEKKDTGVTWAYGYDLAGRLATVEKDGTSVATYTYDANGNRLNGGATYDEEDRQLTGDGATFTYTPNGERKTRVDAAGTTTYGYDGRGHLTSVALPNGKQLAYGVDAQGRRVSRSENGVLTHRWLFRSQLRLVAEVDASGELTTRYVYGTKVNVPDYFVRGGITYAVLTDQLGSVRKVVDVGSGETVQEMQYDAWGVVTLDTNPGFQPFGFAGGVFESATGMVHFGAREYEPATGRWTRKDPIGFGGGENHWAYAANAPSLSTDPSGLVPFERFASAEAAAIDAVEMYLPFTRANATEVGGLIFQDSQGLFFYIDPIIGDHGSVNALPQAPREGCSVWGDYHTHPYTDQRHRKLFWLDHAEAPPAIGFSGYGHDGHSGDIEAYLERAQAFRRPEYSGFLGTAEGTFHTYDGLTGRESSVVLP